ncbi:DUF2798 domain-containing protein [Ottowia caeni]|uniref:DUF2798 domain-containing protein n=1 Tax=Ottowia caeni TaxID=2870339 RepID=UPI003D759AA2
MSSYSSSFKLPARFSGVAFAFSMSAIVGFLMTVTLTALNKGFDQDFIWAVLRGYFVAWPIGFIGVLVARPMVLKLVKLTVAPPKP